MIKFKEDSEEYKLWSEIVNDIYLEYNTTNEPEKANELTEKIEKLLEIVSNRFEQQVNAILPEEFTDKQLSKIAIVIKNYLINDTIIIDQNGKEYPDFIITLKENSKGIASWLK